MLCSPLSGTGSHKDGAPVKSESRVEEEGDRRVLQDRYEKPAASQYQTASGRLVICGILVLQENIELRRVICEVK